MLTGSKSRCMIPNHITIFTTVMRAHFTSTSANNLDLVGILQLDITIWMGSYYLFTSIELDISAGITGITQGISLIITPVIGDSTGQTTTSTGQIYLILWAIRASFARGFPVSSIVLLFWILSIVSKSGAPTHAFLNLARTYPYTRALFGVLLRNTPHSTGVRCPPALYLTLWEATQGLSKLINRAVCCCFAAQTARIPCKCNGLAIIRAWSCSRSFISHVAPGPFRGPVGHKSNLAEKPKGEPEASPPSPFWIPHLPPG